MQLVDQLTRVLQIVDKDAWKKLLGGAGPDRLDAVAMAVLGECAIAFDIEMGHEVSWC